MSPSLAAVDQDPIVQRRQNEAREEFLRTVGALNFSEQLTSALSSQNLRALDYIRREKLYVAGGYQTFDDFLDHDAHSPMKSDTFRRRWSLLQGEGDETFNLLTSLKVPFETRKLLAGEIQITDSAIKIGDAEARLDDNDRIVDLISTLHKKAVEQQRTIDRGKKDVDKWKRKADEAQKRAIVVNPNATTSGQALLTAAGALTQLKDTLADASEEERDALREPLMTLLSQTQLELSEIYSGRVKQAHGDDDALSDDDAAEMIGA